jgi:ketosteroid isomerase-like protein
MEANQVRKVIEEWATGVRVRDIDAVLSRHAPDLLMFDVVGPVRLQGLDAYRRTWLEQFFPWHVGIGRFELVDLKVSAGADVAFATALLECAGTEDGKKSGLHTAADDRSREARRGVDHCPRAPLATAGLRRFSYRSGVQLMPGASARDLGVTQRGSGCAVVPYNKRFQPTPTSRRG